ncbi:MAG: hypothetical protein ABGX27_08495 [Desulfurobacteriaceae bacterium]
MLLEVGKFLVKAVLNEMVRKQTNGIFSTYDELKEWNDLSKSLNSLSDSKEKDDDFSIFKL